jgi:hypothetical protein
MISRSLLQTALGEPTTAVVRLYNLSQAVRVSVEESWVNMRRAFCGFNCT